MLYGKPTLGGTSARATTIKNKKSVELQKITPSQVGVCAACTHPWAAPPVSAWHGHTWLVWFARCVPCVTATTSRPKSTTGTRIHDMSGPIRSYGRTALWTVISCFPTRRSQAWRNKTKNTQTGNHHQEQTKHTAVISRIAFPPFFCSLRGVKHRVRIVIHEDGSVSGGPDHY